MKFLEQTVLIMDALEDSGCYDAVDGFFYDRDLKTGRLLPVRTVAGLMPLLCESMTESDLAPLIAALDDPDQFATPFPVPSVAAREPSFVPGPLHWGSGPLIWRGPSWINTNWLLHRALVPLASKR